MENSNFDDVILVKEYINGNKKKSFGEIYSRYLPLVYRYIYSRIGHKESTEDLVSETFMTLIEILDKYDGNAKLSTFIIGIAVNKMRQFIQKNRNTDLEFIDNYDIEIEDSNENTQSKNAKLDDDEMRIEKCLSLLEERESLVLRLRFIEGWNVRSVSEELKLTQENVRIIQFRAIKKLKKLLEVNANAGKK